MTTTTTAPPVLEPAAQAFAEATANPPYLFDLGPEEGRKAVDEVQSGDDRQARRRRGVGHRRGRPDRRGPGPDRPARAARPAPLPVILYIHGAGWVFGNAHTHDRLVRELAVGADAAVVFPEYDLSPEARYPVAIEQNYAVARWVVARGRRPRAWTRTRHRGRRRLGRRQHGRRADPDGQGARRRRRSSSRCCSTRSPTRTSTPTPTSSSPRATSCAATACSGSGTSTRPTSSSGRDHRVPAARDHRAAGRTAAGAGHHRRGRRPARRGRGVRQQAARGRRARSPRSASRASSTTS